MGSDYSILDNDIKALDNSYRFLLKNKDKYDPDFVSEVELLYYSTVPATRQWTGTKTSSEWYLTVSKSQFESYQKLRKLLLSPKVKKREMTASEQVIAIASALEAP